jgi:predicted amidohydrolase
MRLSAVLGIVLALAAMGSALAAESADKREQARAERSIALGVNLITWDQAQPEGGWTRWSPRPELAPGYSVDRTVAARGVPALRLSGQGRQYVYGGWRRTVANIDAGKAYRFAVEVEAKGVPSIRRNVICEVKWLGPDLGNEITPEYVNTYKREQGYSVNLDQTFLAPDGANAAEITLLVQWVPTAELMFKSVVFETAKPETARVVKVATVYWRPADKSTPAKNVEAFSALIDKAAEARADVVLLPEGITSVGTGLSTPEAAEEMPGATFLALAAKAKEHHCYIIYGAYEKEKDVIFNSAFIIARDGTLAGTYHKVQLPYGEPDGGLSPGDFFRTFQLDFGKVGILICHDAAFDEGARVEMLDGAEIIFVPIWGGDLTQLKARAMDNGIYLVTSGYDVPSAIIDPAGEVLAMTWKEIGDGVASNAIDLTKKIRRPWIGDWHNAVIKQRRTDAYQKVVED